MNLRKEKDKPKGREAKSEVNRTGQAWKSVPEKEIVDGREIITGFHHFACDECRAVVRMSPRGWAQCTGCGAIFNDHFNPALYDRSRSMKEFARSLNHDRIETHC